MSFVMPQLLPHQLAVRDWIVERPKCGIFLDIGGGKSLTTLTALAEVRPSGHILVIAPINIARSTWVDEIEKWNFPLRSRSLIVSPNDTKISRKKRLESYQQIFHEAPTIYFINIDLIDDLVKSMPVVKVNGKNEILWPFPTLIIDESQTLKNPSAVRFKALKKVAGASTRIIELTGTPTPQSLLDIWSQMYLLDGGLALGENFSTFRSRYFRPTMHIDGRPVKWEIIPGSEELIYAAIGHKVMSARNTSVAKPSVTVTDVEVDLPTDVRDEYKSFVKHLVMELATPPSPENPKGTTTITADNAGILHGKLIQFASGTMYTDDQHNYTVVHSEKMKAADNLIRKAAGSPVLLAYKFKSDRKELLDKLTQAGHAVEAFDGSRAMVKRWNSGAIPVMILQPASAGHGLNLQDGGHTLIWYTLPDSLEHYLQTNGRLARLGQQNPVQIWRLITKGTRDEKLPTMLAHKKNILDGLIDAVKIDIYDFDEDIREALGDLDLSPW